MNAKEELTLNINNLKKQVQELIDYKKNSKNLSKEEIQSIDKQKKEFIEKVDKFTNKLKEIIKKEKQKTSILNNIKKAQNANDSINYHFAKKYGDIEDLENLKNGKQTRENVRQEYLHYLNLEENFYKLESKEIPGILFLHQDILNEYGLCPYIIGDVDLNEIQNYDINKESNNLEKNRKEWLNKTKDNGSIYYKLFENIFQEKEIIELSSFLIKSQDLIEQNIKDLLTESQYRIYKDTIQLIIEYNNCTIKTKKIKEKYKLIIHNLSILHSETNLSIHKYLEYKFSINLPVNLIYTKSPTENDFKNQSKNKNIYFIKNFEEYISEYKTYLDKSHQKRKYITNIIKNLKQDFHDFLMKKSDTKFTHSKQENKKIDQEGKYFKNWSNLTIDEKYERLQSFSIFYINKFHYNEHSENLISQLFCLLKDNLDNKKITCKDLIWKVNKGTIEKIKILKFNKETNEFYIEKQQKIKKENSELLEEKKLQKSLSKKSILHKNNEKTVNEEMLKFILKYNENNHEKDIINYIDEFIDKLKNKLKLKKISKDDKSQLTIKLIDMNKIITHNPCN